MHHDGPTAREGADGVTGGARPRERRAPERDDRARVVDDTLALDPAADDAEEVARLAAPDRRAAEDDRAPAAGDRGEPIEARPGDPDGQPATAGVELQPREQEVLTLLARGLSAREIGADLYLSVNTVKTHTRTLYRKLGVRSRVAAANWARDHGYGSP